MLTEVDGVADGRYTEIPTVAERNIFPDFAQFRRRLVEPGGPEVYAAIGANERA